MRYSRPPKKVAGLADYILFGFVLRIMGNPSVGKNSCCDTFSPVVVRRSELNVSTLRFPVVFRSDQREVHSHPPRKMPRRVQTPGHYRFTRVRTPRLLPVCDSGVTTLHR